MNRIYFAILILAFAVLACSAPTTAELVMPTQQPTSAPTLTPSASAECSSYVVQYDNVNVRSGAGTEYSIVRTAHKGDSLTMCKHYTNSHFDNWLCDKSECVFASCTSYGGGGCGQK